MPGRRETRQIRRRSQKSRLRTGPLLQCNSVATLAGLHSASTFSLSTGNAVLSRLLQATAAAALFTTAAAAADLPRRAAPPAYVAVPVFTWTGFYAGTLTGYSFSDEKIRTIGNNNGAGGLTNTQLGVAQGRRPGSIKPNAEGFTSFGGNVGYDYQFNPGNSFVVGVAADATLMDIDARKAYGSPAQASNGFGTEVSGFRQKLDYLGTVRGRVGYAFDRFLVYGTGGFAYGKVDYSANFFNSTNGALAYTNRYTETATGYVYGGGVEYALPTDSFLAKFNLLSYLNLIKMDSVSVKAEFLHYDLGSHNVVLAAVNPAGPTGSYTSRFTTEGNLVRGGFTYRFGGL
jgi:outer membrane immunogenic protein